MTTIVETGFSHARQDINVGSMRVIPVKRWGRVATSVIVALLILQMTYSLAINPFIDWGIVADFIFSPAILRGLWSTMEISMISVVLSLVISVIIAVMRMSESRILQAVAFGYVFFFRGIPLIVLLIFVGNIGLFIRTITIGIPFTDIVFYSVPSNEVFTPFVASIIGLSLVASAYMSEIVRGGLLSIDRGQTQAAKALGKSSGQSLRYILLPQAMRVIVPPLGNEFITTIKMSALVSVIAGGDLLTVAQSISGVNYRTIELLIVATIWYLVVVAISSVIQRHVEDAIAER